MSFKKVNYICSDEDRAAITAIFLQMDTSGDGRLSREELIEGLHRFGVKELTGQEAEALFRALDTNVDGYLTLDEFFVLMTLIASSHPQVDKKAKLRRAFAEMDKNKDGSLSEEELYNGLKQAGIGVSRSDVTKLTVNLDKDGDGKIDFEEFVVMFSM